MAIRDAKCFGYQIDFVDNLLGHGGFGTVYKGHDDDGVTFAIKRVSKTNKRNASTEAVKAHFLKKKIKHDHVVKVHDVKNWKDSMWIVMEYCNLGDLNNFFEKYQQNLDTKSRINIMDQISKGIAFLHDRNIVHRDIKPGNILLKRKHTYMYAIVKLGDFGLSRILDPDDLTSAMSSNVGTLTFKAPEFWNRGPDDRVRYHRNVDVFAAGLTFTAMLQARSGGSLVPYVECSLQPYETKMPIGFAAFTRYQQEQNEIQVVVQDRNDTPLVNNLKSIIETMTCFSPEARISASEVEERFDVMKREFADVKPNKAIGVTSRFSIGDETMLTDTMCYVKNHLIITMCPLGLFTCSKAKVYDEIGNLVKEWECCHVRISMMGFEIQGKEYLLEGCPICEIIRAYEFPQIESKILCEEISPGAMCKGPNGTILVFDNTQKSLKQLRYCEGKLLRVKQFHVDHTDVYCIHSCFSENCDTVIVLDRLRKTLTGFHLPSEQVAWQHNEIELGSSSPVLTDVQHILTLPDKRVCVFTTHEVFALNPVDGTMLYTLHPFQESCIFLQSAATYYNRNQQKLAIFNYPGTLSVFDVPFQPSEVTDFLLLKDIISDK